MLQHPIASNCHGYIQNCPVFPTNGCNTFSPLHLWCAASIYLQVIKPPNSRENEIIHFSGRFLLSPSGRFYRGSRWKTKEVREKKLRKTWRSCCWLFTAWMIGKLNLPSVRSSQKLLLSEYYESRKRNKEIMSICEKLWMFHIDFMKSGASSLLRWLDCNNHHGFESIAPK